MSSNSRALRRMTFSFGVESIAGAKNVVLREFEIERVEEEQVRDGSVAK